MGGGTKVMTSETGPWAEQKPYLLAAFDKAKDLYNKGSPAYYPAETLAGFDPAQMAAQQATLGYAMGPRAAAQQGAAEQSLIQGLSGQVDPNAYNPLANALQQQVMGNLKGNILPGLRDQLMTSGQQGGSSRNDLIQNKAIANAVQSGMTKPLADMYTNAYNQAQQRAVQSGQLYPGMMNAPMSMYDSIAGVGKDRRAMSQAAMDKAMQKYQYESTAPMQSLANYMNMIQGNYGGQTTQTTPGPSGLQNMSSIVGMIGSLAGLSDRRVKENVKRVGTHKGMGVYDFNYLWSPKKHRGMMAQEVEKKKPEAVFEISGLKGINYDKV